MALLDHNELRTPWISCHDFRHNELDRCLHEKEAIVAKVREASQEREDHLLQKLRALEGELESERLQNRQLAWTNKDLEREKEAEVKK